MVKTKLTKCQHCGTKLDRWANPELTSWGDGYQLVCFNDECPYFVRGRQWMDEKFAVSASYRFRCDPKTGETGPLPVWSKEAMRENILPEEDDEVTDAE